MKKELIGVSVLLILINFSVAFAGGGIAHMFLAEEVVDKIPILELRTLLQTNLDVYRVGAYYPDSGYIAGGYGEISHWDPFIYAFADYIKETYPNPSIQNPKLVAFLFGCAVHRVSDEILHNTFYTITKVKDFKGDYDKAHQYGDVGIDLILNIDHNQWQAHPKAWWIPLKDLLAVYQRMGEQVKANDIIWGNQVLSLAGFGERLISIPAYLYLQLRMPWTARHYYTWPQGGFLMNETKIVDYQIKLWHRLTSKSGKNLLNSTKNTQVKQQFATLSGNLPTFNFAKSAIQSGVVQVETTSNDDGSIEIQQPIINQANNLKSLLDQFLAELTK